LTKISPTHRDLLALARRQLINVAHYIGAAHCVACCSLALAAARPAVRCGSGRKRCGGVTGIRS